MAGRHRCLEAPCSQPTKAYFLQSDPKSDGIFGFSTQDPSQAQTVGVA